MRWMLFACAACAVLYASGCGEAPQGSTPGETLAEQPQSQSVGPQGLEIGRSAHELDFDLMVALICVDLRMEQATSDAPFRPTVVRRHATAPLDELLNRRERFLVNRNVIFDRSCSAFTDEGGLSSELTIERAMALLNLAGGEVSLLEAFAESAPLDARTQLFADTPFPVAGRQAVARVFVSSDQVRAVRIHLGGYAEAVRDEVLSQLIARYVMLSPSDAQLADFNAGRSTCISYATADASVVLEITSAGVVAPVFMNLWYRDTVGVEGSSCLPAGATGEAPRL